MADYQKTNLTALQDVPKYSELDPTTATYFHYTDVLLGQTVVQAVSSYDMDEEDEQWLTKTKAKVRTTHHAITTH